MSFPTDIKSSATFESIQQGIIALPDVAKEIAAETGKIFQFCIKGGAADAYFLCNLKDAPSLTYSKESREADCTMTMEDSDYIDMAEGRLDGMSAYMQGKLQISGDLMAAQSFAPAMEKIRNAAEAAGLTAGGKSESAGGGGGDGFPTDIKSSATFSQLKLGIAAFPAVAKEICEETNKIFQFCIKGGEKPAYFLLNFKGEASCTYSTESQEADCTLTMDDADYIDMAEGRLDGMSAFMQGKLRIDGDMMAAQSFAPAVEKLREAAEKQSKL